MATTRRALPTKPRLVWAAVSAALLPWCYANPASADVTAHTLPTGGTVVAGSASVSRSGSNMEINQSSNSAILNWQSFSIGSNAWVNFIQPSSSAIALNRVLGNKGSEIFGRLTANGQVFLSNPNGVLFAPGASVDVGGLFATTLSIADKDFLAGRYNFYNAGGAGSVINQGNIVTANGYAALAGPQVRNDGIIVARAGTVALAAGDRVSLDMVGDGLIKVSVDQSALNASAINSGRIEADGGNVLLTARSANALLDTVINNSGVIRANTLIARNGEIVLDGGSAGLVANTGTLSAAGADGGATGGTIKVLGDRVALLSGAQIDASGDSGGGTVLVGGNFHGSGPEQDATVTSIASDVQITADALNSGDGGKVVVWSNGDTLFAGSITARGGALSGNGGFIETSGKHLTIGHAAYVNASAAHGARGKWLLDPTDIDITDATTINSALGGGTDTVVTTDGNITADDLITWAAAATLTLTAGNDVVVNQAIAGTAAGANVVLIADNDGTHSGTVITNAPVSADNITIRYNPIANDYGSPTGFTATAASALDAKMWVFVTADNKVYDATDVASLSLFGNAVANGALLTSGTGTFDTKHAGTGKTVTYSGQSLAPGGAAFELFASAGTTTADVAPALLSINAVTDTKVYDATTSSGGVPTVSGLLGGDAVSGATQAYASKNVLGTSGSTLQVSAYTVNDGNSGNNYTVTTNTAAGTITPALLTLNAVTDTKVYDATTTSSAVPTVSGLQGADSVGRVQAYASKNVLGTNGSTLQVTAYTVNDGNSGNNYTISTSTAAGTITPASLTVNAVSDTKVYDATTSSTGVPTVGGLQGADTVSAQAQAYASKNVLGTNGSTLQVTAYTVNDGNLGNNYAVTSNTAAGTITPKALTAVSLTGTISKTYDGNASATLIPSNYTISGFVAGEGATITNTVGSYGNGKDVQGPAAPVSSAVLASGDYAAASGTLLSNYDLSAVTGVAATGNIGQITRLGSVSAISNGLWSSASTWQGGAIPDKANVANVSLNGFAVTFDNSVGTNAGVTNLDSLTGGIAGSKLTFTSSNQLQVLNALNVQGYAQTAGTVATGTTFSVTNNFNQTGGTINSGAAVNITQASGGLNAFSIAGSATLTLTANNATGDIVLGSGAGLNGTTVTLTAGRNVSLNAPVSGSSVVNVSFGQQVAGTFTPTATIGGTTTVTGGGGADTFDLSGAPSITATLAGGAGSDTLRQSGGKTWTLNNATANAGSSGGLTWSSIENLTDTGAGAFNMGTSGSLSGTISAASGSISYASHAGPVTFNLNGGASTGMASWNGITNVAGGTGNDAITGTSQTYTVTGSNAGSNGTVTWNSFENLTDLGTGTLRATSATWTLNGSNTGTVTNLSGTFAGMGNLTDLGTGTFNMHGTADGSITGNLDGGTNGTLSYAGYSTNVTISLSGASTGVGGTRSGITFVTGSSNDDAITGAGATYNLTGQNSGSSGGLGWASFENITDATGGSFFLFVQDRNVTGTLSSGNLTSSTTLTSASEITALRINVPGTLALIGTAPHWTFNGPPDAVPHLETNNPQTNVTYNSACIGGPACNTVIAIIGSINASVSQIAAQALKDAQATDSVAKQIEYGFAGDVGTTPPMDHRIDETGISTPDCFDESREGKACNGS